MARRHEARREEMRRLLAACEASGRTIAQFAREHGMSPWTLYRWNRVLRAKPDEPDERADFVEVKVVPAPQPSTIAVELPSGARVHVPTGFEENELRRLLAVLSSC